MSTFGGLSEENLVRLGRRLHKPLLIFLWSGWVLCGGIYIR